MSQMIKFDTGCSFKRFAGFRQDGKTLFLCRKAYDVAVETGFFGVFTGLKSKWSLAGAVYTFTDEGTAAEAARHVLENCRKQWGIEI